MLVNLAARNGKQAISSVVVNLVISPRLFETETKQKSFKGHYHAKRAEKQENADSERNTVVP